MANPELEEWSRLARSIREDDKVRHTPPAHVWDNIQAALANDPTSAPATPDSAAPQLRSVGDSQDIDLTESTVDEIVPPEDVYDLTAERTRRAPAAARQQRRRLMLAGAAAILAVVIGASVFSTDTPAFVAEITNADLPEPFDGTAQVTLGDGDLGITLDGTLPTDEPVELWVIKPDLSDMRSLGIVQPGDSEWEWPADLDPAEYSLVDLSIEPDDGDPTHSGRSILRGPLTAT